MRSPYGPQAALSKMPHGLNTGDHLATRSFSTTSASYRGSSLTRRGLSNAFAPIPRRYRMPIRTQAISGLPGVDLSGHRPSCP
jgi:hypothetical protein